MPRQTCTFVVYVDDSGSPELGTLWSALAFASEYWTIDLERWLGFRKNLYAKLRIPTSFEIHSQAWLSRDPLRDLDPEKPHDRAQLLAARDNQDALVEALQPGKAARRDRSQWFIKGLKTIGKFEGVRLYTVFTEEVAGAAKEGLYCELLDFIREDLEPEDARATVIVDGLHEGHGLRGAHRGLPIRTRRVIEDAGLRRSADSQLLQMADMCAYAAFQSIKDREDLDTKFKAAYARHLGPILARPFEAEDRPGRWIKGLDC